jgi:hypothetical protein
MMFTLVLPNICTIACVYCVLQSPLCVTTVKIHNMWCLFYLKLRIMFVKQSPYHVYWITIPKSSHVFASNQRLTAQMSFCAPELLYIMCVLIIEYIVFRRIEHFRYKIHINTHSTTVVIMTEQHSHQRWFAEWNGC